MWVPEDRELALGATEHLVMAPVPVFLHSHRERSFWDAPLVVVSLGPPHLALVRFRLAAFPQRPSERLLPQALMASVPPSLVLQLAARQQEEEGTSARILME